MTIMIQHESLLRSELLLVDMGIITSIIIEKHGSILAGAGLGTRVGHFDAKVRISVGVV